MGKKNYARPFMSMEMFRPNEYCSNCGPTETDLGTLYAQCKEGVVIKISFINPSGDGYQGQTNGDAGHSGMLYNVGGNEWVFAGPIDDDSHTDQYRNGEYLPAGLNGDTHNVGDYEPTTGITYCNHTMAAIGQHHHLTNGRIVYVNQS